MRVHRALLTLLALLLLAVAVVAFLLSRGSYARYPRAEVLSRSASTRAALPAWTSWCRGVRPGDGHFACARVSGRVIWVQKEDPDGDGDRHVILMARLHPRIVKFTKDFPLRRLPGIGDRVTSTGWVQTGGSGHQEIDTIHLG